MPMELIFIIRNGGAADPLRQSESKCVYFTAGNSTGYGVAFRYERADTVAAITGGFSGTVKEHRYCYHFGIMLGNYLDAAKEPTAWPLTQYVW